MFTFYIIIFNRNFRNKITIPTYIHEIIFNKYKKYLKTRNNEVNLVQLNEKKIVPYNR